MSEFFVGIFYNASMLITLIFFFACITFSMENSRKTFNMIVAGLIIGIMGISLMLNPMPLMPGIFFDTRTILLAIAGFFYGWIPTLIASTITIIFRFIQGGSGAYVGSLTILIASLTGLIFRQKRYQQIMSKKNASLDFYLMGFTVHALMLCSMLLLPEDSIQILRRIAIPIIVLYPLVLTLISMIIKKLQGNARIRMELKDKEENFQLYVDASPYGIFVIDDQGSIIEYNRKMIELCGVDEEDLLGRDLVDLFHEDRQDLLSEHFTNTKLADAETNLTLEYLRHDGDKRIFKIKTIRIKGQKILGYLDDITAEESLRKEIEYLNYHDSLSGVFNRRFFEEECKRLDVTRKMPLGIVIGDVNGLKITNDGFGHLAGDDLIKKAADAMQLSLRKEDIIARWGGDEFIILLPQTGYKDTLHIIERIQKNISKVKTQTGILSISFGMAVKKEETQDFQDIFKKAEDSMYRQKMYDSPSAKNITLRTIINTLYESSPREEWHSQRVASYAKRLSKALGYDERYQKDVEAAGMLHDIGKIAVGTEILEKKEKLTSEDWHELRKHPEVGYRILQNVSTLGDITHTILSHHEWYDGSGYPQGLCGESIPELSRIISVADAYDAMISDRPYRLALSVETAKQELEKKMGTQFDPRIARVFLDEVLIEE